LLHRQSPHREGRISQSPSRRVTFAATVPDGERSPSSISNRPQPVRMPPPQLQQTEPHLHSPVIASSVSIPVADPLPPVKSHQKWLATVPKSSKQPLQVTVHRNMAQIAPLPKAKRPLSVASTGSGSSVTEVLFGITPRSPPKRKSKSRRALSASHRRYQQPIRLIATADAEIDSQLRSTLSKLSIREIVAMNQLLQQEERIRRVSVVPLQCRACASALNY
jgi:hypothetical protein